ncbi:uncharacterized protein LOC143127936 [Alosa pseudoharengus]|uniref:uncharacterized protein LOC143127936 n=1 Tax=Alosa pseudoharengus TaxID=34774 RepID=UPI003F89A1D1
MMEDVPNDEGEARAVRVLVFLVITLTVSLPALGWALASLFTPRKNRRVSGFTFLLLLLLSDVSEVTMTLSVVRTLMGGVFSGLSSLISLESPLILLGCRLSGLYLHQLVAIESTLHLKNPQSSAQLFSFCCSVGMTILCILIVLMFIIVKGNLPNLLFVMLSMFFTCACVLLCLYDISKTKQQAVRQLGQAMMALCLFTVAVLHGPLVVYMVVHQRSEEAPMDRYTDMAVSQWGAMALAISSLRVLADALLCVLACREIT